MPRMRDITTQLLRKLEKLPPPRDPGLWCRCDDGRLSTVITDVADCLADTEPDTKCRECGKSRLLVITVAGGDEGRKQVALLGEMECVR